MAPSVPGSTASMPRSCTESSTDSGFFCHHCVKEIGEGMPVYMCRDASYCSAGCRRRGRSAQYAQLMGLPLMEEDSEATRTCTASDASTTASDATSADVRSLPPTIQGRGVLHWILSAGFRQLTAMAKGTELLQVGGDECWGSTRHNSKYDSRCNLNESRSCLQEGCGTEMHYQRPWGRNSSYDFALLIEGGH